MQRLSVVIANYNYARFLGHAVDSALAVDWPDVEVVVVDDGSTDGSADVIRSYGGRVTALLLDNGGQREACNRGFAASTGDVVIFLDADDVLPPEVARRVAAVMGPRTSKVQVQMQRISEDGRAVGEPFPRHAPSVTPASVRHWMLSTSAYPTPPGSGNAYARWFLDQVLPAPASTGDFVDSACLAAAPLLGDVVALSGVCVGYRQHGGNDSHLLRDTSRFAREVTRARNRWAFAQRAAQLAGPAGEVDESALFRSRELLQFRAAASRVAPAGRTDEGGLPGDSPFQRALDALRSPTWPGPEPLRTRLLIAAWTLALLAVPARLVPRLLQVRYGR